MNAEHVKDSKRCDCDYGLYLIKISQRERFVIGERFFCSNVHISIQFFEIVFKAVIWGFNNVKIDWLTGWSFWKIRNLKLINSIFSFISKGKPFPVKEKKIVGEIITNDLSTAPIFIFKLQAYRIFIYIKHSTHSNNNKIHEQCWFLSSSFLEFLL